MRHWLLKTEPSTYSIDDLQRDGRTTWEGVRNYQARNWMRDDMKQGDLVLIYHSNADPPGVVGVGRIARGGYPDPYQFEAGHKYYDPDSKPQEPRWMMVDVEFVERFETVPLDELKAARALDGMEVVRKGSRLSVQPVSREHFDHVLAMGRDKTLG